MKKVLMSLMVITGTAASGFAGADTVKNREPPVPKSAFEESITVTFAGLEEALRSATLSMIDPQMQGGLKIAVPNVADFAVITADSVEHLITR